MKKILILTLVLFFPLILKSQVLTGTVYNNTTKLPVAYATVYYDGSAIRTLTSESGQFAIPSTLGNVPLVISSIGYHTFTINEYSANTPLKIYLDPKISELEEVVIRDEGISYEEKVKLFKREFLGVTINGKDCNILNIDDIKLTYNKKKKTLTASSDVPLEIENRNLGYQIHYFLDKFIKSPTGVTFEGNFVFKDIPELATQKEILRNREKVYKGSRMHFIRALYSNKLDQNGFKLTIPGWKRAVNPDSLLTKGADGRMFLSLSSKLAISYYNRLSYLSQNANVSTIDKTGFHDVTLKWSGKMTEARVGDLLPFDYNLQSETENESQHLFSPSNTNTESGLTVTGPSKDPLKVGIPGPELFFEKVYLHTDRDLYGQGDTLWYKAYITNAQNHRLVKSGKNLYVELFSVDSGLISKQMIRLEAGTGKGDFTIYDSLPSGKYQLRAYTRWMLNFEDAFIFRKDITVLNTVPKVEPDLHIAKSSSKGAHSKEHKIPETGHKDIPNIRFFPEGGQLVEGLTSLVAIKAEDNYGMGIAVKGALLDLKGDTVTRFSTDSLGFGLLVLQPIKGQHYRGTLAGSGDLVIAGLPKPLTKGMTMRIANKDTVLQVIIGLSDPENPVNAGKKFSLVGKHRGQVYYADDFEFTVSERLILLPASSFPGGIVTFTLYDGNKPVCERLVFVNHGIDTPADFLNTDKKNYRSGDSVTINIKSTPNAHLSLAVVDAEVVPVQSGSIISYLMLESELKGRIEQANRYFDDKNINRFKQLDLLLMTQGWREFIWRRLADTAITIKHEVENGFKVAGKVTDKRRKQPLAGINVSLYASAARGTKLFSTQTDSLGRFLFPDVGLYGDHVIKLAAVDNKGEKKGTIILDTVPGFSFKIPPAQSGLVHQKTSTPEAETSLTQRFLDIRKRSIKLNEVKIRASRSVVTMEGVFSSWGPEQSFKITEKDHEFKTLQWWVLQNIRGAFPDEGNGVYFRGIDTALISMQGGTMVVGKDKYMHPRIFVNGIDYLDAYRFFTMPIEIFDRIVLKPVAGNLTGISNQPAALLVDRFLLYLYLKEGAFEEPEPGSLHPLLSGYYAARDFYVSHSEKMVDLTLRPTLHWAPSIVTNEKGDAKVSFKNTSPATRARIIMQGLTQNGQPVAAIESYEVAK